MDDDGVGAGRVRWSLRWAVATMVFLGVLAIIVPQGLALVGFLAVVIAVHEAGHLVVARRVGMVPTEFFWGFGPEVVSVELGGCRYGVRAVFAGGYVKLHGMTPSAELPAGFDEAGTYRAARHRDRLATILAGPGVNLGLAVIAFSVAAALEGASVGQTLAAGPGDTWFVARGTGEALWRWVAEFGAYWQSFVDPTGATEAPVRFLSPVAQADVSGWAVSGGAVTSLRWLGVLSVAVGVVNLLPLPPLDGSHAVVAVVEGVAQRVTGRRRLVVDVSRLAPLAYLTLVALVFLSVSALVMDIRDL